MANSRVSRGRRSQLKVTEWFRDHGWEGAENTPASLPGKDVTGMPGWAPEVKATRDGSLTGAMKQAKKNADEDETPFVVWRPDGYGEERIGEWLCVFALEDATRLMREVEEPEVEVRVLSPNQLDADQMLQAARLLARIEALEAKVG